MKKFTGTLAICVLSLGLIMSNMAPAAPLIIPTDKSSIEVVASDSGYATLRVGGDLVGKFAWAEVYYKDPQENGKYSNRFQMSGNEVKVGTVSALGLNFGQGEDQYLMLDEIKGFPGKLVDLAQINGEEGKGAKLSFK